MADPAINLVKRGSDVVLTDRQGRLVTVAEHDAHDVLAGGEYLPATAEQVALRDREKKYGGAAGQLAAGAAAATAGAFDAATAIPRAATALGSRAVGAHDPLAGVSGRNLQEDLVYLAGEAQGRSGEADVRRWREGLTGVTTENPYTTLAGRVAGEALGSAGIGAAGKGAGALAGRGVAALGGGAGVRALTAATVAGATEGALYSQGQVSEEAYLRGDRETTAEKTLAGMGLGAVLGGGVALGVAGASRLFGRAGSRAESVVDSPVVGSTARHERELEDTAARTGLITEPAPGFGGKLNDALEWARNKVEDAQSAFTGADRETLRQYGALNKSPEAMSGRQLWMNREPILERSTQELVSKVDDMAKASRVVTDEVWDISVKAENVAKNLEKLTVEQQASALSASAEVASTLKQRVNAVRDAIAEGGMGKKLGRDLESWANHLDESIAKGDVKEAYMGLDSFKRVAQKAAHGLRNTARNETNLDLLELKMGVRNELIGIQEEARQFLQNDAVWGAQGVAQREANAASKNMIDAGKMFRTGFTTKVGEEFAGRDIMAADPAKISSYVRGLGRQEGALRDRMFRNYVESVEQMGKAVKGGYQLDPESARAFEELQSSAKAIRETLAKADKTVKVANQIDAVLQAEKAGGASVLGGAFGGGLVGGAPGAALGAAFGAVTRPGQMIRQMAAIEQLAANVDRKMGSGIKGFFDGFAKRAAEKGERAALPAAASRVPAEVTRAAKELPKRALIPSTLEAFRGKEPTAAAAYQKRAEQLISLSDPNTMNERQKGAWGDLPTTAPRFSADLAGKTSGAVQFLLSKLPSGINSPTVLMPTRKAIPSDLEIAQFARYWSAATNPLSVFDELKRGTLTHEHVEAVQAVYPKLYEHMQTAALDSIRKAATDGVLIPYQARLQLALLLNLGADADPTLDPGLMVRVAGYMQSQAQTKPAPASRKPIDVSSRLRSSAESMTLASNEARR